jgi:hypothetical protein
VGWRGRKDERILTGGEGTCKSKVRDRGILKTCVRVLKGLYLFMEGH